MSDDESAMGEPVGAGGVEPSEPQEPPESLESLDPLEALGTPEWPEELVELAELAPDHLIRIVDSAWTADRGDPPEWAVGGAWLTDSDGKIVEGEINENYRPSPLTLGWAAPVDSLDEAVQLAATGYGPESEVARQLAEVARVMVFLDEDGEPAVVRAPDGADVVSVSCAGLDVDETEHPYARMPVTELLERTESRYGLHFLSPTAPVSAVVTPQALLSALEGRSASEEPLAGDAGEAAVTAPVPDPARGQAQEADADADTRARDPRTRPIDDLILPEGDVDPTTAPFN
ncbi:type VII secretion system-associated protein [Streptomyces sp. NPDC001514]